MFERASGQKINVDKSSVFFSKNTDLDLKQVLCNILRFNEADDNTKYLGLPKILERNKSAVLGYLKDLLQDTIKG